MSDQFDELRKYWRLCGLTFLFWIVLDLSPAVRAFPVPIGMLNLLFLVLVLPAYLDYYSRKLLAQRKYSLSNTCAGIAVMFGEIMNLLPGNPYAAGLPYFMAMHTLTFNKLDNGKDGEFAARRLLKFYKDRKDVPPMRRAQALVLLGTALGQQGKYQESEKATRDAIDVFESQKDVAPSKIAASLADLCVTMSFEGKSKQALEIGNKALALMENCSGGGQQELILLGMTLNNLAVAYNNAGNAEKALELYKRSLKLKLSIFGDKSKEAVIGLNNAGYAMLQQKQIEKSAEYLEKAKLLAVELKLENSRLWPNVICNCGDLHREQGRFPEAEKELLEALKVGEQFKATNEMGEACHCLGKFYRDTNDFSKSDTYFRKALTLRQKQYGVEHYNVCLTLEEFAKLMRQNNRENEAVEMETKAAHIRSGLVDAT